MNILLLYMHSPALERFYKELLQYISLEHNIEFIDITNMNIAPCRGCFYCWVKTPGECIIHDEQISIARKIINSDLVMFLSPLILGYLPSKIKHCLDRLIPLLHPYIELIEGECHHRKRYDKYPDFAVLFDIDEGSQSEDILILRQLMERLMINFHGKLQFFENIEVSIPQIVHSLEKITELKKQIVKPLAL